VALDELKKTILLGAGENTKADPRVLQLPAMAVVENGIYKEVGGVQKRYGGVVLGNGVEDGTTLTALDGVTTRGTELVRFGNKKIYARVANSKWMDHGTYDQGTVTQTGVSGASQFRVSCDRAQTGGVVCYVWESTTVTGNNRVRFEGTGGGFIAEQSLDEGESRAYNPRCIAVNGKFLIFYALLAGNLKCMVVDPADVLGTIGGTITTIASDLSVPGDPVAGSMISFDVVTYSSTLCVLAYCDNRTSAPDTGLYTVLKVDNTGTTSGTVQSIRAAGTIAIDYNATAAKLGVIRWDIANDNDVNVDILDSAFAETVVVDQLITASVTNGSVYYNMACAWRDSAESGGEYRLHVWYDCAPETAVCSGGTVQEVRYGWLDTTGVWSGGGATWTPTSLFHCSVVSAGFGRGSNAYCWLVSSIPEQATNNRLQDTYFLIRDDGYVVGRLLPGQAYGDQTGRRAAWHCSVQDLGSDQFAIAVPRRATAALDKYVAWSPETNVESVTFNFADTSVFFGVDLGETSLFPGSYVTQYDGEQVTESGFLLFPEDIDTATSTTGGSLTADKFSYRVYFEWVNGNGERERSTYSEDILVDHSASGTATNKTTLTIPTNSFTNKTSPMNVVVGIYRTTKNPGPGALFYRVNKFVFGAAGLTNNKTVDGVTYVDTQADATIEVNELDPESAGYAENVAPEPCKTLEVVGRRVFYSGLRDRHAVGYSKLITPGFPVEFNADWKSIAPSDSGFVQAVSSVNDAVVILTDTRCYLLRGEGPDNSGAGDFADPMLVTSDAGAIDGRNHAQLPTGLLFLGNKGWYMVRNNFTVDYIGAPAEDYNGQSFNGVKVMESDHYAILLAASGSTVVYDYLINAWGHWSITGKQGALWNGAYVWASGTNILDTTTGSASFADNSAGYSMMVETPWIPLSESIAGFGRLWEILIYGEYRTACDVQVRLYYNGLGTVQETINHVPSVDWTGAALSAGKPFQVRIKPKIQKASSVKINIRDRAASEYGVPGDTESFKLTSIDLRLGVKKGLHRLPAGQTD
jgi:hypothetical protein